MWKCQECGKKFRTTGAAERAANYGCPKCGGCDIDIDVSAPLAKLVAKAAKTETTKFTNVPSWTR